MDADAVRRLAEVLGVDPEVAQRIAAVRTPPAEAPAPPPKPEPLYTVEGLKAFEQKVADAFKAKKIRAPIHLSGGNEEQLLSIFEKVDRENDWVCTGWRSHYHCLLKGVPQAKLMKDILAGKSITLCYPEHKVISSAIVGGICSIAVGIAAAIRRAGGPGMVWCFVGDMTARGGAFIEAMNYAAYNRLPATWVWEDNGMSVSSPTSATWGQFVGEPPTMGGYHYELKWPHQGIGKRVEF